MADLCLCVCNREKLKSNPPVPLVQDYLKCTSEPFVALFDAVGIAGGNAGNLM